MPSLGAQRFSGVGPSTIKKHLRVFSELALVTISTPELRAPSTYTLLPMGNGCPASANGRPAMGNGELALANATRSVGLATSEETQNQNSEENEKGADAPAGFARPSFSLPCDSPEFSEAWNDYKTHRSEIRKPLEPMSSKLALRNLSAMGERRAVIALRHTVAKGWQGIREPDVTEKSRYDGVGRSVPQIEPEPEGWRTWLNDNRPEARCAHGGEDEGKKWHELDAETRKYVSAEMRKHP